MHFNSYALEPQAVKQHFSGLLKSKSGRYSIKFKVMHATDSFNFFSSRAWPDDRSQYFIMVNKRRINVHFALPGV